MKTDEIAISMQGRVEEKLNHMFSPSLLRVINQSHLHAGHSGDDGSGESHFRIEITSDSFDGESRINAQRMIFDCLSEEMKTIHALSISIL